MKKSLYLALLAASLLATPVATAAQEYASHESASKAVTKDGYILISYAKGWDRFSEPHCKKILAAPEIMEACGDAAIVLAPIYQYATPDERKTQNAVWGELAIPRANSMNTYPCILMYDQKGYLYGRVQGEVLLRGTMKEIAAEVKTKLEHKHKQEEIMEKAEAASGVEKAKLIAPADSPFLIFSFLLLSFQTRSGRSICADPGQAWVQKYIQYLDQTSKEAGSSGTFTVEGP